MAEKLGKKGQEEQTGKSSTEGWQGRLPPPRTRQRRRSAERAPAPATRSTTTLPAPAPAAPVDARATAVRNAYLHKLTNLRLHLEKMEAELRAARTVSDAVRREIDALETARWGWAKNRMVRMRLLWAISVAVQFAKRNPPIRRDGAEIVRAEFGWCYPEHVAQLSDDDVRDAIRVWTARGTRRTKVERPLKWPFLAGMMARAGFGSVNARSLEQDWIAWSKSIGLKSLL